MLIWAITATVLSVAILILFIAYRRQVRSTCRHLAFMKQHKTNLRLHSNRCCKMKRNYETPGASLLGLFAERGLKEDFGQIFRILRNA